MLAVGGRLDLLYMDGFPSVAAILENLEVGSLLFLELYNDSANRLILSYFVPNRHHKDSHKVQTE